MQLIRISASAELNNVWIVGLVALCALGLAWLVIALSIFLVRQIARSLRIAALQAFADGYASKARLVGTITSFAIVVAGAGTVGYALWQHKDLEASLTAALELVTQDRLLSAARTAGILVLFVVAFYVLRVASHRLIAHTRHRLSPPDLAERQQAFLERFFLLLPAAINLAVIYALLRMVVGALRLPAVLEWFLLTAVYVLLLIACGRALVVLAHYVSERVLARWERASVGGKLEEYYVALQRLLPVVQRSVEAIVYVSIATLLVRRFETLEPFAPYGPLLIRVISMFLVASVVVEVVRILIARLLLASPSAAEDTQRRRITFVGLIQSIVKYIIYFCVCMMVLENFGVDPAPILAGAGILGLTVGLGAQKIVQDLLNGLFLLFEDQILHGDYIKIGDTEGVVEQLSLRLTRVRDRFGRLHILRNGEVQNVINYSRGWTLAVVEMSVSYEDDLAKALRVLDQVAAGLPAAMPGQVLEAPRVRGIETMGESAINVRIETKVAPGLHYDVKRALNRMLVDAFNANGLEIPYPKSVKIEAKRAADSAEASGASSGASAS